MLLGARERGGTILVDVHDLGGWVWTETPLVATASISASTAPEVSVPVQEVSEVAGRRRRTTP
jgi:hypothetical protein